MQEMSQSPMICSLSSFPELHNETQRQLPPLGWPLPGRQRASMGMGEPLSFVSPVPGARRWSLCIPGGCRAQLLPLQRAEELGLHQTRVAKTEEELLHQHLSGSRTRKRDAKGGTQSKRAPLSAALSSNRRAVRSSSPGPTVPPMGLRGPKQIPGGASAPIYIFLHRLTPNDR